jgi:type IV pilus assembly protein PilY1
MNSPLSQTQLFRSFAVLTLLLGLGIAPVQAQTVLADKPIAAGADVPGNLALTLSVEFPTAISIANLGDYSDNATYLGYFDPLKCYNYIFNAVTPSSSFFVPINLANGSNNHSCSNAWSGNFMNWASMQTIDPFRWALTGGYRSVDTVNNTILEKAWGSSQGSVGANFPYRGTSQGGGNNLNSGLINSLTPLGAWNSFDFGIWGNGNAMVFSGDAASYGQQANSVQDLSNVNTANTNAGAAAGAYRIYIRVRVCDATLGVAMLEPNCVRYGAHYKPEGLLQQYSQKTRFSAFGYLNEGGDVRQGGVLRAPMTFIGPNIPQPLSPLPLANPTPEWSPVTGIMSVNPDPGAAAASGVAQSGVMNYLNKFGEFGQFYKTYDNVGELYYAAVRYFENLGNVPEWTNGASAAALDGFPAVTNWTAPPDSSTNNPGAPILYSCQKNFILGIGDDHTWFDYNVGGNTNASGGRPMPALVASDPINQASAWTTALQTIEGIAPTPMWPFDSGATYFIAGLAYGVHVNDIRPDMEGAQTISTYWMDVAEGQRLENLNPYYLASKYGGFNAGAIPQGPPGAPDPFNPPNFNPPGYNMASAVALGQFDTTGNNVNMNGSVHPLPDNYFNAGNANAMVAGLTSAFTSISNAITQFSTSFSFALANVTVSTTSYSASFSTDGWTGTVAAGTLAFDPLGNPTLAPLWSTTTTLQTQLAGTGWQTARRVATWNGAAGVPFEAANLTPAQQTALTPSYSAAPACSNAACPYLNYLRGDRTNEVSSVAPTSTHSLRNRTLLLGDIVDANLTPVTVPLQTFSDANNPGYGFFKTLWTTTTTRPDLVYAGANDGMLHAFNGADGTEQFAYVPGGVYQGPNGTPQVDGLAQIGNPNYVHHNYVDATPLAFDIDMSRTMGATAATAADYAAAGTTPWRTVLIGGLGKGGKSYYAIDITDPANMTSEAAVASKVLWEFTDPTMGYSYGAPSVVKTVKYGWVVILTSGYDNSDGFGYLYFVNPRTGALLERVRTPSASIGLTQASAFVKDFSDFTTDSVYVGDLNGQVWRFNLTAAVGAYPQPILFATATDAGGAAQPITTAPLIEIHPVTRLRTVLFGTGILLAVTDVANTQMQSFYAIMDGTATAFNPVATPITRAVLTPIDVVQLTDGVNNVVLPSQGWVTDLGIDAGSGIGWRMILNAQAFNGIVTFATSLTTSNDPCSPQGTSRVYAVDYATADSVLQPLIVGGPTPPFINFSHSVDNLRIAGDNGQAEILASTNDKPAPQRVGASLTGTLATRILNWREVPTVE